MYEPGDAGSQGQEKGNGITTEGMSPGHELMPYGLSGIETCSS